MEIKDIKQIIDLMKRYGLAEFELEEKDFKIRLRRDAANGNGGGSQQFVVETPMGLGVGTQPTPASPATNPPQATSSPSAPPFPHAVPPSGQAAPAAPVPDAPGVQVIKSPMVGTFYRSPTPEAKVFVDPGSAVQPDTVICIIEAMKLMNEIHAEVKGTIVEVIAENGKPVEYGQPLFKVKVG